MVYNENIKVGVSITSSVYDGWMMVSEERLPNTFLIRLRLPAGEVQRYFI